jgi:hypothetical protein
MIRKFKPRSPDFYLGKIEGDNELARLAHLNGLVDDVEMTFYENAVNRMTTTQRLGIVSPLEGMLVYDLTLHKLYVYDGTTWQAAW